jgi:hypothetical protein
MPVGTPRAQWTVTLHVRFTSRPIGIKTKAIFTPQELAEIEGVHGLADLLNIFVRRH